MAKQTTEQTTSQTKTLFNDPTTYAELSKPFPTADAANDALVAFWKDVQAARKKHRIPDVLCAVAMNVSYMDDCGRAMANLHLGDSMLAESLAAYAYGQESAAKREAMNKLLAGRGAVGGEKW